MSLSTTLAEYIRACFTRIWIESHEYQDASTEIARLCHAENWRLVTWDIEQGVTSAGFTGEPAIGQDPLAAIRSLSTLASENGAALLVLQNFHRFLQSAEIVQALARQIMTGRQHRTFIVILSPIVQIPAELDKQFVVIEHELPGREQLTEIARGIATEANELPTGSELERTIDAAVGLTRYEAEGAFSLSLVRYGQLRADVLWEQKAQMLRRAACSRFITGAKRLPSSVVSIR